MILALLIQLIQLISTVSLLPILPIRRTALHRAAQRGYGEVVRLLVQAGASVDIGDFEENRFGEGIGEMDSEICGNPWNYVE